MVTIVRYSMTITALAAVALGAAQEPLRAPTLQERVAALETAVATIETRFGLESARPGNLGTGESGQALAGRVDALQRSVERLSGDIQRVEHADAVAALCKAHGIPRERTHVHQGGTRELLMALTEQLRADVVVMGAISRSGLKGLFLGNTAEDVLDRLHCDLVIVKPEGFKPALPS